MEKQMNTTAYVGSANSLPAFGLPQKGKAIEVIKFTYP